MAEILEKLGFRHYGTVRKRRIFYRYGDIEITLDEVDGLGTFVEMEKIVSTAKAMSATVERMRAIAKELGLEEEIRKSYLELLKEQTSQ